MIYIENTGLRHGPTDAMEKLQRGEEVDARPVCISAPLHVSRPGAGPYLWLTRHVFVAEGEPAGPDCVELAVYQIL